MARTVRMNPPLLTTGLNPIQISGRTYGPTSMPVDMPEQDADVASQNGWTWVAYVGPTSARPTDRDPDFQAGVPDGLQFIDSTLGAFLIWDQGEKAWRNVITGSIS